MTQRLLRSISLANHNDVGKFNEPITIHIKSNPSAEKGVGPKYGLFDLLLIGRENGARFLVKQRKKRAKQ